MKKTLTTILLLTLLASTSLAWPFNKQPTLQPTPVAVVKPTPKPTIQDGRDLAKGIVAELKTAKEENTKLKTSLDKAVEQTEQAESKTLEVQKSADTLKEWGMIQQAEAQKFMEKYNNAVKRYHRLKVIAAFIAAAAGILFGLQFMSLAPPPYNLGVPLGFSALFASFVWFFL